MPYPRGYKSVPFGTLANGSPRHINITQLARSLDMDPSYLSCALKGTKQLTVKNLALLAAELKMTHEAVLKAIETRRRSNPPRRRYAA